MYTYIALTLVHSDLPEVKSLLDTSLTELITTTPDDFNNAYLAKGSSPEHILGAARGVLEIKKATLPDTAQAVLAVLDQLTDVPPRVATYLDAVRLLRESGASAEQVSSFEAQIKARLPLAEIFASAEQKKKRREGVAALKEEP